MSPRVRTQSRTQSRTREKMQKKSRSEKGGRSVKGGKSGRSVKGGRSRMRFGSKLNTEENRNCGNVSVDDCASYGGLRNNLKLGKLIDASILGSGTYGVIFSSKTEFIDSKDNKSSKDSKDGKDSKKGPDIAIKFVFRLHPYNHESMLIDDMKHELSYSKIMGDVGLGPKIFDNFYYIFRGDKIKDIPGLSDLFNRIKSYKKIEDLMSMTPSTVLEMQCIIMEEYKYDCENLLHVNYVSTPVKAAIIRQMCHIIEKQIDHGIYCNDIKPSNFVANLTDDNADVKMIDFGSEFCTKKNIYGSLKNDDVFYKDGDFNITAKNLLQLSNTIQLFMTCISTGFLKKLPLKDIGIVYEGFNVPLLVKFLKYRYWKRVITQYINYGMHVLKQGRSNPATILIWYTNGQIIDQKMFKSNKNNESSNKIIICINTALENLMNYFVRKEITYYTYSIKTGKTRDNINFKETTIKTYDYN